MYFHNIHRALSFFQKKGCKIPGLAIFSSTDEQDQAQEQFLPRGPNKKRK